MRGVSLNRFERHVQNTLTNYVIIAERRYSNADYGACDILMDLEKAISKADLTNIQWEVLRLLYTKYFNQVEVAEHLNISKQMVSRHNSSSIKKIARYYMYGGGDN